MKIIKPLILLICLVGIGCESPGKVRGVYVFKYGTAEIGNSELHRKYTLPSLICFNEDSIRFERFEMDKTTVNSQSETYYYEQTDSTITIFRNDTQEVSEIDFRSTDSLILREQQLPEYKSVLISFPRYGQKSQELDIRKGFQEYGYKSNSKDDVFEFDTTGFFSRSQFPTANFGAKRWDLISYDNELFLTNLDYYTRLIHIQDYKDGVLTGITYADKDQLVTLNPVEVAPTFDSEELIGEWEDILDVDMPLPPIADAENYLMETLNFEEHMLIRRKYNISDTVKWFSTQFNNKIIINGRISTGSIGNQWNVVRLEKDELTIRRYNDRVRIDNNAIETIRFRRRK